jgi:hypothetical protein
MRVWNASFNTTNTVAKLLDLELIAGVGLDGGGVLGDLLNITFDLADTAVTPGTYGDSTYVGSFTVDQQGRITAAEDIEIDIPSAGVDVENDDTPVASDVTTLNFEGDVIVTDDGGGKVTIEVVGGGGGGGGGSGWELADEWVHSVTGDTASPIVLNDAQGADELMIIMESVTKSISGTVLARLSDNNGSSFYSTNGYSTIPANGNPTLVSELDLHQTNTTAARRGHIHVINAADAPVTVWGNAHSTGARSVGSANPVDAVQLLATGGGNFTGGSFRLYKRTGGGSGMSHPAVMSRVSLGF